MVRLAAFLGSALVNLACAQLVAMPPLVGLRMTEPSLVDRSADLAGLGIVSDFRNGPAIELFDVLNDPCLMPGPWRSRSPIRQRHSVRTTAEAIEDCFPET